MTGRPTTASTWATTGRLAPSTSRLIDLERIAADLETGNMPPPLLCISHARWIRALAEALARGVQPNLYRMLGITASRRHGARAARVSHRDRTRTLRDQFLCELVEQLPPGKPWPRTRLAWELLTGSASPPSVEVRNRVAFLRDVLSPIPTSHRQLHRIYLAAITDTPRRAR